MITVVLMAMIIDEHFGDDENEVHSSAIVKARILFIMRQSKLMTVTGVCDEDVVGMTNC